MKLRILSIVLATSLAAQYCLAQQPATDDRTAQRIQREVRHELIMLSYLGVFDNLAYKVNGSTVYPYRPGHTPHAENRR